ncbi:MAG: DNA polymerase III subunit gamma/tau [Verrucomicrobiales bacterium]|nr:DNA polymerase III subunit gamma/tau [Verrucomicrobiales bacterium]
MSYLVIARKYRPQRFADVVGQEHVTRTLENAIKQNRLAHAYLFCGPRGTGKTTIARIFAKCLNCTNGPRVDFDVNDPRCIEIAEGRSLDVLEIDGASNRGIDEIRELRETVKYAPATSRFKIYIIDEVHMLTKEAFNALLKTLEEPPPHVKFMFATTEPEKVLPTIMSRCQRFDLRRIPVNLIVKRLRHIATLEGVQIDDAALYAIARGADGAMRDAESALDQLISFCGGSIHEEDVLAMFGLTAQSQLVELADAILNGDAQTVLVRLDTLAAHGKDLGRLLADLLNHFRNLLVFKISPAALELTELPEPEANAIRRQAAGVDEDALRRIMEVLTDAEARYRDVVSKKIFVEIALLKAAEARNAVSVDSLLKTLGQLRAAAHSPQDKSPEPVAGGQTGNKSTAAKPVAPVAKSKTTEHTPAGDKSLRSGGGAAAPPPPERLLELWAQLLEAVGRVNPFVSTCLLEAHPVEFANGVFTIGFDPAKEGNMHLADNGRDKSLLETKLGELGYPGAKVKIILSPAPADWATHKAQLGQRLAAVHQAQQEQKAVQAVAGTRPMKISPAEFKSDPLIMKALEIFKGQIMELEQ